MTQPPLTDGDVASVRDRDLRQLARHSGLNVAGSFVAAVLNLLLPVLITRGLARDDAGVFFQVTAMFTILVNVGTIGADTGLVRWLPRAIALRRPSDIARTLRISSGPPLGLTVLLALVLVVASGPIGEVSTGSDDRLADVFGKSIALLALFLPVAVLYALGLSASRGLGSVLPLVVFEKVGRGIGQVVACALALAVSGSVLALSLAWAVPYVAAMVVLGWWTVQRVRRMAAAASREGDIQPGDPGLVPDFWKFSIPRAASRIFSVALQRADIIIVGALRGPADAAIYTAATRFPILGLMFVQAIQQVMAPRISEFLSIGAKDRAETMYRTTTAWLILVSWPIYLVSVWFATLLLDVFGSGYDAGAVAVVVLCLAMLVATGCGPVDAVLLMGGRSVLSLFNTGMALLVTVGLDLLLVPEFGVTGAAVGWTVGIGVNNLLPLWQVHKYLEMHPFGAATVRAAALSLVAYGATTGLVRLVAGEGIWPLLLAGFLGTVVFALGLKHWFHELELPALVAAVRARRRARS